MWNTQIMEWAWHGNRSRFQKVNLCSDTVIFYLEGMWKSRGPKRRMKVSVRRIAGLRLPLPPVMWSRLAELGFTSGKEEGSAHQSGQNHCSLVWQDIQVLTAKCQVSCFSSAELGITRSLFMGSTNRSVKTAQTGKKPQFMPCKIYSLKRVHMNALENIWGMPRCISYTIQNWLHCSICTPCSMACEEKTNGIPDHTEKQYGYQQNIY